MLCKNTILTFTSMSADTVVLRRAGGGTTGTNSRQHSSLDPLQLLKRQTITLLSLPRKFAKSRSLSITWVTARTMDLMKLVRATTDTCCPAERGAKTRSMSPRNFSRARPTISPAAGISIRMPLIFPCLSLRAAVLSTNNLLQPASSGLINSHRKATSNRLQASSVKRQATGIPAFGYRREGGPIGYKLLNRGPRIKFYCSWIEGLD